MLKILPKLNKTIKGLSKIRNYSTRTAAIKIIQDDNVSDVNSFKKGEKHHGFVVEDVQKIDEFNITAIKLKHDKTKAEYLHLYRNDNNNTFSINFRTTPKDSTGLPHILEHTVLCGSELYPVRDPFFKMLNRSLATFMNACTGSDYTIYPFSTQNLTDYRNLQKIYLDAVFRPNLKLLDFMQEGWRLEHKDPNDVKSDIIIKGVVYNEMKGVFADNEAVFLQKLQNTILPDDTYSIVFGGDPLAIPNLKWEALKTFHKEHYHPSNCKFFSYGNFPLMPALEYINTEYMPLYDYLEPSHTVVSSQNRWDKPKEEHILGRFENMKEPIERQNMIAVSLLMSDVTNIYETFVMHFLTELLIKGPNSPFYKSMIEENFSGGYIPSTGFDTQPRDTVFTVGLTGLNKKDFPKVIELFDKTIDEVVEKGFEKIHIDSVLHTYELSLKHEASSFGLILLFGITPTWNHNGDIMNLLKANELIGQLQKDMKIDDKFLQKMVKKFFKNNNHRLILSLSADTEYENKQLEMEKALIKKKVKQLSKNDKENVQKLGLELQEQQSKIENIDILPTLTMSDINSEVERIHIEKFFANVVPTQVNRVNTNGIVYFRGLLNTVHLTPEQQMLLPLFCNVITKLGTPKLGYREFDTAVNLNTSGLNLCVHTGESLYQLHTFEPGLLLSSYCLEKNLDNMFDLWQQIFSIKELKDINRFKMLVQLYMTNLTQRIVENGHVYAMDGAAALVSGSAYQKELLSGLQHITYMKRLVGTASYEPVLQELANLATLVFDKTKLRCALNVEEKNEKKVTTMYEKFINELPGNQMNTPIEANYVTTKVWTPLDAINCQHYVFNIPIHYCSKAILGKPYTDPDYARLRVMARLLSLKYLHPELREKNGAYGGGARLSPDGVFTFFSYRDPRNLQTLDVFDKAHNWLEKELTKITEQEILEAKLGVFQQVDAPIIPSNKGINEFLRGLNAETLQRHRSEIMSVDRNALQSVSDKYLGQDNASSSSKVILGPKSDKMDTGKRTGELWTVFENE